MNAAFFEIGLLDVDLSTTSDDDVDQPEINLDAADPTPQHPDGDPTVLCWARAM